MRPISSAAAAGPSRTWAVHPGEHAGVGVRADAESHAHQHVLSPAFGHGGLEAVDVVCVVDHDQPRRALHRHGDLLALGVAVHH